MQWGGKETANRNKEDEAFSFGTIEKMKVKSVPFVYQ